MNGYSRIGWIGVLAVSAAFTVAAQPAAADERISRPPGASNPNFAVESVRLPGTAPHYVVLGRNTSRTQQIFVKVTNTGNAAAAGAGKVTVMGNGELTPLKAVFQVRRLRPDQSRTIEVEVSFDGLASITTYTTKACASTRQDSNNANDCRRGPEFAVIPERWVGNVQATYRDGLAIQSLVANTVTFAFDHGKTKAGGSFVYTATGSLTGTIIGDEDPDCTYSGTGDTAIQGPVDTLTLPRDLTSYMGRGTMPETATYPAVAACEQVTVPFDQAYGIWFATEERNRQPDDQAISGTHTNQFGDTYSWDLRAE